MSELDNILNEIPEDAETESEVLKAWAIPDDAAAEWALNTIAEAKAEAEKWREFYQRKIEQEEKRAEGTIAFFTAKLRQYFDTVPHHTTKTTESYELPSGKLVLKAQEPEYKHDEPTLIGWAKTNHHEDMVKTVTKESFDWASFKKGISAYQIVDGNVINPTTGEVVPGITVENREPKFTIK